MAMLLLLTISSIASFAAVNANTATRGITVVTHVRDDIMGIDCNGGCWGLNGGGGVWGSMGAGV